MTVLWILCVFSPFVVFEPTANQVRSRESCMTGWRIDKEKEWREQPDNRLEMAINEVDGVPFQVHLPSVWFLSTTRLSLSLLENDTTMTGTRSIPVEESRKRNKVEVDGDPLQVHLPFSVLFLCSPRRSVLDVEGLVWM